MTPRLPLLNPAELAGKARGLLDGIRANRGHIPGLMRVMAASPAALGGFLALGRNLAEGVLPAPLRERIAIATAAANGCAACLAAHELMGEAVGLDAAELAAARDGVSAEPAAAAALAFAAAVLREQGRVADSDIATLREFGLGDAAMLEIVAVAYLNAFSNAVNNLARTPADPLPQA